MVECGLSLRGVGQAFSFLPFLGLSSLTSLPSPQPGWSPGTKRQPTTVPCYRSMHSDATSAVSVTPWQEEPTLQIIDMGTGAVLTELDLVAPSASPRAVPELAASTERDLAGPANSSGCL